MSRLRKLMVSAIIASAIIASQVTGCQPQSAAVPESEPVCEYTQGKPEEDGKDIYAFITTDDWNDATHNMETVFEHNLSRFGDYSVHIERVGSVSELNDAIKTAYEENGSIDGMVLAFHGNRTSMKFSIDELSVGNVKYSLAGYDSCFSDDARLLLYSCSVGKDGQGLNLAEVLHEVLDVDVDAPKSVLIPEDGYMNEWIDQFMLDEKGLPAFNYNEYRIYDRVLFRGDTYTDAIATGSYAERDQNIVHQGQYTVDDMFLKLRVPEIANVSRHTTLTPENDTKDIYFFATPYLPDNLFNLLVDFENEPARFPGYSVHVNRVSSVSELKDAIKGAYKENGSIDGMILYAHGTSPSIVFSHLNVLSMQTAETELAGYDAYFSDDARLLLYSCLTGADSSSGNIAEVLHDVLDVDVDAPKFQLVHYEEFVDQFVLDEDGLLAFNYDDFRLYDRMPAAYSPRSSAIASLRWAGNINNVLHKGEYTIDDMFLRLR